MNHSISRRNWALIWIVGLTGQLCWNVENQLFNTFVYTKIAPAPSIVAWMVGISAAVTTISTFWIGSISDRLGRRKPFISIGYILWGFLTVAFGATEFVPKNPLLLAAIAVIAMDAIMSFFGSMANDSGFMTWTTDISNEHNRGQLGAVVAAQPVLAIILGTIGCAAMIELFDYFAFFVVFGAMVSLVGIFSIFTLKDQEDVVPNRDNSGLLFFIKSLFQRDSLLQNRELLFVIASFTLFFISFNIYFPYMMIYFQYTLGFSLSIAGILMAAPLLLAVLVAFGCSRFINHGRIPKVFGFAILSNVIGLLTLQLQGMFALLTGILFVGIGYIIVMQCMTAWMKNLYPKEQRGQSEGLRIIASVLIPMIIGPGIGSHLVEAFGAERVIQYDYGSQIGHSPSSELFLVAALVALTTFLPLHFAAKRYYASRILPPIRDYEEEQKQLSDGARILNPDGTLAVTGYTTGENTLIFNRNAIKTRLRIKEWDFYQIQNESYCLQLTIGHVSYVGSVSLMLFALDGSKKIVAEQLIPLPFHRLHMPPSAEQGDVTYTCKDFEVAFQHQNGSRHLVARSTSSKYNFEVDLILSEPQNSLIISTPFYETNEFYFNHKIGGMNAKGQVRFDELEIDFLDERSFGLLDWGRGVWPFKHEWYWGAACTRKAGKNLALNIGWGFGDTSAASENIFFLDGIPHKLGQVYLDHFDLDAKEWHFMEGTGRLNLSFKLLYNRITENRVIWIDNHCDQVFGVFTGTLLDEAGIAHSVADMYGFFEHARNQW